MVIGRSAGRWQLLASSRAGASHKRGGRCNQDAVGYRLISRSVVVAVADGHGSSASPYSDIGAQIAVEVACCYLKRFIAQHERSHFEIVHERASMLPTSIVQTWRRKVADTASRKRMKVDQDVQSVWLQFGSTLVAAALHPEWILLLQLGDGDILVVEANGKTHSFAEDIPEEVGEASHSLCEPNAEAQMRWQLLPVSDEKPLLILCTDGYSKSFATQDDFLQSGRDWFRLLQEHGCKRIQKHMDDWLDETSSQGSGDDVSVAVAYWQCKPHAGRSEPPRRNQLKLWQRITQWVPKLRSIRTRSCSGWGRCNYVEPAITSG